MKTLCLAWLLVLSGVARAQTPLPPVAPVDVILRTDGREVRGRVLTITPLELRYLSPTATDTLRLTAAEVFLVRYANGTREVLHPLPPATPPGSDPLPSLTLAERRSLGRQDANRYYRASGPFWASLGATLYMGPLVGVAAPALITPHPVKTENLAAPYPSRLNDFTYNDAYRQEARRRKRGRAWGGYAVGAGVWVVLIASLMKSGH